MDNELENQDSLNLEETQDSIPEEVEEPNPELVKAKELAQNYKVRAEKAEQALKKVKTAPAEVAPKNEIDGLSLKDIRALQDVADEDVEEVTEFAKFKGISITEAKKTSVIQNLLKTKAEERRTAEASNTTVTRKSSRKDSSEEILSNFSKGQVSEKDEDIQKLAEAMLEQRKARAKSN
jgi:hypothetical protein